MGRHLTLREYETTNNSTRYVDETTRRIRLDDEESDETQFDPAPSRFRPYRFK